MLIGKEASSRLLFCPIDRPSWCSSDKVEWREGLVWVAALDQQDQQSHQVPSLAELSIPQGRLTAQASSGWQEGLWWVDPGVRKPLQRTLLLASLGLALAGLEGRVLLRAFGQYLGLQPPWSVILVSAALYGGAALVLLHFAGAARDILTGSRTHSFPRCERDTDVRSGSGLGSVGTAHACPDAWAAVDAVLTVYVPLCSKLCQRCPFSLVRSKGCLPCHYIFKPAGGSSYLFHATGMQALLELHAILSPQQLWLEMWPSRAHAGQQKDGRPAVCLVRLLRASSWDAGKPHSQAHSRT